MAYDPPVHRRPSIRLRNYDYSRAGAYFITVCAHEGRQVFANIRDGQLELQEPGKMVADGWFALPRHYPHVRLDEFVVMPNHVHGIIILSDVGAGLRPAPTAGWEPPHAHRVESQTHPSGRHGLPEIVRAFKSFSARRINRARASCGRPVWQRNYYEHIIRPGELELIRDYIRMNPLRWTCDRYNPAQGVLVIDETGRTVSWQES